LGQVTRLDHPANKFIDNKGVGALHKAEAIHGAIALARVVQADKKTITTEAAHFWVAAHNHIKFTAQSRYQPP